MSVNASQCENGWKAVDFNLLSVDDCKYTLQFSQLNDSKNGKPIGPKEIGIYPETGELITIRRGPYGPYMQLGEGTKEKKPKRVSLPKNFNPEEIGLNTAIQ